MSWQNSTVVANAIKTIDEIIKRATGKFGGGGDLDVEGTVYLFVDNLTLATHNSNVTKLVHECNKVEMNVDHVENNQNRSIWCIQQIGSVTCDGGL